MQNMSTACSSAEALYFKIARFNTRSIIWLLSQAHAFEHDSFLRNGRHGDVQHVQQKKPEYEIFMKRENIHLTFTFKGWFSSAMLNFLFKSQTICYWWFAFIICWWQWRWLCQIYSPAVLIYATQNPTRTRPGTRTFNHYPTRTRPEVKKCYSS